MTKVRRLLLALSSIVLLVPLSGGVDVARAAPPDGLRVGELRTEYAVNPLGLDTARPRLSWVLESTQRATLQAAYRVLVATAPDRLAVGEADVWDSGVVASRRSLNVGYAGPALDSATRYFWTVRVWDHDGDASAWSEPAWWETALLAQSDWQARWIGAPPADQEQEQPPTFSGARWIWYPEGNPEQQAPEATRYFRRTVGVPSDAALVGAELLITADDQYVLYLDGQQVGRSSGQPDAWRQAAVIDVTDLLGPGSHTLAVAVTNTGGPASWIAKLRLRYADGTTEVVTDASWKAFQFGVPGWQSVGFDDSAWPAAMQVASYGEGPWGTQVQIPQPPPPPSPLLRTGLEIVKPVRSARVYVSGLGNYELRINGERVGDRVLAPDRNDYGKRVPYNTYDVTGVLRRGQNAVGAELGRGWYALKQPNAWRWHQAPWIDEPKLRLQLEVTYADGSTDRVVTGPHWRVAEGPTRSDSVYGGETYDARHQRPGWDRPGYDDSDWAAGELAPAPEGRMSAEITDPIRVVDTVQPSGITNPADGVHVVDMGRVMAGWARLTVSGPAGTKVTLRYGEKLNGDGTVQWGNGLVPGRHQTDEYLLRGDGVEVWEPKFSYKGFRYVQVEGLPSAPTAQTVAGRLVHSDVASVGRFGSDNPLYGTFHAAMRRTILNNLHGIPTDTPMYEKNGWTGDAQVGAPSMTYNFDMARFFTEWLADIRDSQVASGQIPVIVPSPGWGYQELAPSPEWTAVYPIVLWQMYLDYGDRRVLAEHFAALRGYVDWEIGRLDDGIARTALGDWVAPGYPGIPPEDTRLSATAYVYRSLTLTAAIAEALGRTSDADRYQDVAGDVRERFNAVFLDRDAGHYRTARDPGYRQTNNLLPLAFGMVPGGYQTSVVDSLVADIRARNVHLNTGALGTSVLLPMLSEHGHHELAHAVANQTTYPSWGYWFANGADTMWEYWGLNSRSLDHYFLGTIDEWFYEDLAGINARGPGFREFLVRPRVGGGLHKATGTLRTGYGEIEVEWETEGTAVRLVVTVPANTTATVHVPTSDPASVTEGGGAAAEAEGVRYLTGGDGVAVYQVGSGRYTFETLR